VRDACWRAAASALVALSDSRANGGAVGGGGGVLAARLFGEVPGHNCATLAAPLLVETSEHLLREWCASGHELGDATAGRAAQLCELVTLLANLTLPAGALHEAASSPRGGGAPCSPVAPVSRPMPREERPEAGAPAGGADGAGGAGVAAPPSGPRAHLMRLAPALIDCIGAPQPLCEGQVLPEVSRLQRCVRSALREMAGELGLYAHVP